MASANIYSLKQVDYAERGQQVEIIVNQKLLLGVVLIKSNINVVWNFYWLEKNKLPGTAEIIYKSKSYKKSNGH